MTSDAIVEGLCGAISTIVSSALQDLSYDQTIICTIVDNSKSSNGNYQWRRKHVWLYKRY